MSLHKIKKGLSLPISGEPKQELGAAKAVSKVAVVAADYVGMGPRMLVEVGSEVKRGQPLFEDRKMPGIIYTSPGAGKVGAIHRGDKRALLSVVIELNDREQASDISADDSVSFVSYTGRDPAGLGRDEIRELLLESGLWTAIRQRPFSKVANPEIEPHSIFITAMDTNPLAPEVDLAYAGNEEAFEKGLLCIAKFREGQIYLCTAPGSKIAAGPHSGVSNEEFAGIHPAGTVGVHIHTLCPASRERIAWYVDFRDVIAMGKLFMTGALDVERIISLGGPQVENPRLVRTRMGASTDALTSGELNAGENRVISGSVLSGRAAAGEAMGYLGRYHHQISVLLEGTEREFLGWMSPGKEKFSTINTFISKLSPSRRFDFTTSTNGSVRAMVPIGMYERVMPMDMEPTFLLRALAVGDIERAEQLGCLELDEEDLALCTFVCPGKTDYGPMLRANLTQIEKEG